jgi:peroxiredoxin
MKRQKVQIKGSRLRSISIGTVWCICVTAIGTLPGVSRSQQVHPAGRNAAPTVGAAAIGFDLKTLEGKAVGLGTFRGKPLVMNFFASWCDPCRDEMPLVNELGSKASKDGYNVLGIAVEDGRAAVTEYAKEANLVFPIALDLNGTVKRSYRIFGPPATFFIDAQGVIREVVIGPITLQSAREGLKKTRVLP